MRSEGHPYGQASRTRPWKEGGSVRGVGIIGTVGAPRPLGRCRQCPWDVWAALERIHMYGETPPLSRRGQRPATIPPFVLEIQPSLPLLP